ncbi:ATP-binding protein [Flammeovirga sp. EKP202]|uniref:sensor histidine kinase n=1 Tax=Flammeovirga sp. EKP202 TaxID=2770592 RepID=UPI00165F5688|nr:ATP-binding protein [Flammeovirga sp. EKP202]MBD0400789.1 hypothetical protein [Flammeovirga sp. EKP202]
MKNLRFKEFVLTLQNIGAHEGLDADTVKKIHLTNSIAFLGCASALGMLFYAFAVNTPFYAKLVTGLVIPVIMVMPLLNYCGRYYAARVVHCIISLFILITVAIVSGPALHSQFLLVPYLGLPFILFDEKLNRVKVLLSSAGIIGFIYLEWHFKHFEPLIVLDKSIVCETRLLNEIILFCFIIGLFYFFTSESNKYLEKLKKKNEEVEEKNKELEHFAYICSHDLSEPLRTVDGFIGIIKEESDPKNEKLNTYFHYVQEANKRMNTMILSLLAFSKLQNKNSYQITNSQDIIHEIEVDLNQLILEKEAMIEYSFLPTIHGLPTQLKQVFQNLIINGIKYQPPNAKPIINITCEETPDYWEFCVADNGIGIKVKNLKKIFHMFTRLHLDDEFKGQGIGLSFCKKIVEIHKGKIWVESEYKKGSQFYFTIKKDLPIEINKIPTKTLHYKPKSYKNVD